MLLFSQSENRQFEARENEQMKVHARLGRELFVLIYVQGAWRYLRLKISIEWFRLFYFSMIHIGKLIKEELHRQERSITWFANKLCCERTNVYSIFKRESIDTILLFRISLVLHHNFFNYYIQELADCDFFSQNCDLY